MAGPESLRLPPRRRPSLVGRVRGNFLTGLVVVAPVVLTAYLIWTVITFIDAAVVPWVPARYNPGTYLDADIPGFGVVIFILFTAIVGTLTKNLFGRQIVRVGERFVEQMPIVRTIYNGVKQIIETILSQTETSFKQCCLIEYPRKDMWSIGFVATETKGEIPRLVGEPEMLSIFVPTTPNPTSGFLLFVPRDQVILLEMSLEQAAKLIISGGIVSPPTAPAVTALGLPATPRKAPVPAAE